MTEAGTGSRRAQLIPWLRGHRVVQEAAGFGSGKLAENYSPTPTAPPYPTPGEQILLQVGTSSALYLAGAEPAGGRQEAFLVMKAQK